MATPLRFANSRGENQGHSPYVRVIVFIILVAVVLRLAAFLFVLATPQLPRYLIVQCIGGLVLSALAFDYLRRGNPDHAALLIGFEFGAIAVNEFVIGLTSNLAYLMLVHPFLTLTKTEISARMKIFLATHPPLAAVAIRFWFEMPENTGLLTDHALKVINASVMLTIVTVIMAVTLALTERQKHAAVRARRLAESRKQLIDDMSHEMRTPIAVQRAAAQQALSRNGANHDQLAAALEVVETQSSSLALIVDQMLHLAAMDASKMDPVKEDPLVPATQAIVRELQPLAHAHGVALKVNHATKIALLTDASLLRFVLTNLVSNAIRYSPQNGVVKISMHADRDATMLTVTDQGPGIAPELRERIFDRFWRVDAARSRDEGHVGLGLSVARRYARQLGATLTCEEAAKGGAAFIVRWDANSTTADLPIP